MGKYRHWPISAVRPIRPQFEDKISSSIEQKLTKKKCSKQILKYVVLHIHP